MQTIISKMASDWYSFVVNMEVDIVPTLVAYEVVVSIYLRSTRQHILLINKQQSTDSVWVLRISMTTCL